MTEELLVNEISLPAGKGEELDPARQQKAKEYARLRRRLMLLDIALGALYLGAWLFSGGSLRLREAVAGFTPFWTIGAPLTALALGLCYSLIDAPLSYYSGFVLPHRYGLSTMSLRAWLWDEVKGMLVAGAFGLLVLEVVYALLHAAPDWWWLWTGAVLLLLSVLLTNLAPVLIMPLFYKFQPLEDNALTERLRLLAERSGTRVQGVYRFDMSSKTTAANAALTGLGKTRRIILGDTLLKDFSVDEIETIMAHELGHQLHRDLPLSILVQTVITLGGLWLAHLLLRLGVSIFGFSGPADLAAMPLLAAALGFYGILTMPLGNGYSRWRERLADGYALQATGNPRAFASAMTRLANQNLAEAEPAGWEEFLLYSHPSIGKRVAMAREFENNPRNSSGTI